MRKEKVKQMKLVTYSRNNRVSCGILTGDRIIDIPSNWQGGDAPRSLKQILKKGADCLEKLKSMAKNAPNSISLDLVKLLAPIPTPDKAIALAGNYTEHIKEVSLKKGFQLGLSDSAKDTTVPRPFIIPSSAIIGQGDTISWPVYSEQIDYEIELAVVIGKEAKYVSAEDALNYVAGYTIANDVSARSVTFNAARKKRPWDEFYDWLNGKWADGFLPMGPYLITADEIENPQNLELELKVNGEIRQQANTSRMIYPVADIISFLSHLMTLQPGDIIATGTPAGVAAATGNFLHAGDKIECKIEKLGTLTNILGKKPTEFYKPLE